ncbi:MAG: glycosyltransferase [Planctomycetota bacterium]|nr:glycosyltransferase [Planctomycetota bacterium]
MKILYHHRTQANDGQAVHIRALQRAFRELGHKVREVGLVEQGGDQAGQQAEEGRSRWGWVTKLPRFALELAEYSYSGLARRKIVAAARDFRPDFLYERYAFGNLGGVMASRTMDLPLVLEVNSPLVDELDKTRGLALRGLAHKVERAILGGATKICVVTQVLGDIMVELGADPERIVVTPNGVHPSDFDYDDYGGRRLVTERARRDLGLPGGLAERGDVVLGFVGFYRDWHRLDLVVELLARPGFEHLHFCVIGEGPAGESILSRAAELGVSERLHLAGPREHGRIPTLLPAFDIALMPAINPYASALKLHEYMAAGLPILAPDQPNLKEVVADDVSALLVPPGELDALEAAVGRLVGDAELRARLGRAAAAAIVDLDLTWQGNARRVLRAMEDQA